MGRVAAIVTSLTIILTRSGLTVRSHIKRYRNPWFVWGLASFTVVLRRTTMLLELWRAEQRRPQQASATPSPPCSRASLSRSDRGRFRLTTRIFTRHPLLLPVRGPHG